MRPFAPLLPLALCLPLTACGGGEDDKTEDTPRDTYPTANTGTGSAPPVTAATRYVSGGTGTPNPSDASTPIAIPSSPNCSTNQSPAA